MIRIGDFLLRVGRDTDALLHVRLPEQIHTSPAITLFSVTVCGPETVSV
jgi:hypothetical protein